MSSKKKKKFIRVRRNYCRHSRHVLFFLSNDNNCVADKSRPHDSKTNYSTYQPVKTNWRLHFPVHCLQNRYTILHRLKQHSESPELSWCSFYCRRYHLLCTTWWQLGDFQYPQGNQLTCLLLTPTLWWSLTGWLMVYLDKKRQGKNCNLSKDRYYHTKVHEQTLKLTIKNII